MSTSVSHNHKAVRMKAVWALFIGISLLNLPSCTKNDIGIRIQKEAWQKIIGKWTLERKIEQVYEPIPVLSVTNTITYGPDDYYFFNTNLFVDVQTGGLPREQWIYEVINPTQIIINDSIWRIEKLDPDELILLRDINKVTDNKRFVTKMFLRR